MTTSLTTVDQEKLSHLAEEIKAIVSESRNMVTIEMIAMKYCIGETIVLNPLYKKHAKTQGELFEEISKQVDMQARTLADCVKFYETYPRQKPRTIAEELYTEHGSWSGIRRLLRGDVCTAVQTSEERSKCKHCSQHCPCLTQRE